MPRFAARLDQPRNWTFKTNITLTEGPSGNFSPDPHLPGLPAPHHRVPAKLSRNCSMTTPKMAEKTFSCTMACVTGTSFARFTFGKRNMTGETDTKLHSPEALGIREQIVGLDTGPGRKSKNWKKIKRGEDMGRGRSFYPPPSVRTKNP